MRIILDTNVFISGIFYSGPPSQILKAWENRSLQIVLSRSILSEYQRVSEILSLKFPLIDIKPIIELITIHCELIDTHDTIVSVCEDPDDDKFFECAIAGKCKIIISGDKHLLNISGYDGIRVLKPRNFVDIYL